MERERFAKIVNGFYPLTIFGKYSILDVWQGSEYSSELDKSFKNSGYYGIFKN